MAGIYIHIPFCRKACIYCDFQFSTNLKSTSQVISAICLEIKRCGQVSKTIDTIYFGGGTPSLLSSNELNELVNTLHKKFIVDSACEFTIEVNPEDVNYDKIKLWKSLGFNRVSLGIQSFNSTHLQWMNRSHTFDQSKNAMAQIHKHFENVSIDLIYGLPTLSRKQWQNSLMQVENFKPAHLSVYCLTVENKTLLHRQIQNNEIQIALEEEIIWQFKALKKWATKIGYEHYEISNFAREGKYARHNSNYWLGKPYFGFGPSAHSFDGDNRWWNIRNNHIYMKKIMENKSPIHESEKLSPKDKLNDYIITRLRTKWGLDLQYIKNAFGKDLDLSECLQNGWISEKNKVIRLSDKGMLYADAATKALLV